MSKPKVSTRQSSRDISQKAYAPQGRKLAIAMLRAMECAADPDALWADRTWRDKGERQKNVCAPFLRVMAEFPETAEGFGSMLTHVLAEMLQGMAPKAHDLEIRDRAGIMDHAAPGEHWEPNHA